MRPRRFERLTYGLGNRCSIQLSYGRIVYKNAGKVLKNRLNKQKINYTENIVMFKGIYAHPF